MELKDTVDGMLSRDYRDRFKAEYHQLEIRANSLGSMLLRYEAGVLDFEPTCPISVLEFQWSTMTAYLHCLQVRAEIEGIDLDN